MMNKRRALTIALLSLTVLSGMVWAWETLVSPRWAQEDTLKPPLETWYAYRFRDKHYGYAHEKLTQTQDGYDYQIEAEAPAYVDLADLGEGQVLALPSYKMDATLDKNFMARSVSAVFHFGGKTSYLNSQDAGGNLKLIITLAGRGKSHTWTVSKADEFYVSDSVAMYALKEQGQLGQLDKKIIRLLTWWDRDTPIQDIDFQFVKQKVRKTYLDKEYGVYQARWAGQMKVPGFEGEYPVRYDLFVDGYGRTLEQVGIDGVQIVVVANSEDAKGKGRPFNLASHGRDPFRKDMVIRTKDDSGGGGDIARPQTPGGAGKARPEDASRLLNDAGQLVREMQKLKQERKTDELEKKYNQVMDIYRGIRTLLRPTDLAKLRQLKAEVEQYYPGAQKAYQDAQAMAQRAQAAYVTGKCNEITTISKEIAKMSEDVRLAETDWKIKVIDLLPKLQALGEKCLNLKYLNEKRLEVTGVASYDDYIPHPVEFGIDMLGQKVNVREIVYVAVPQTYAIVNSQVVKPGSTVEKEILVKEIVAELGGISRVRFAYKNVEREVLIGPAPQKK